MVLFEVPSVVEFVEDSFVNLNLAGFLRELFKSGPDDVDRGGVCSCHVEILVEMFETRSFSD